MVAALEVVKSPRSAPKTVKGQMLTIEVRDGGVFSDGRVLREHLTTRPFRLQYNSSPGTVWRSR